MTELNEAIKKLRSIGFALDNVSVKGRDNLDVLLGSIQAIDQVVNSLVAYQKNIDDDGK